MASSFRVLNSSTGIPSPTLALFVVMLPKAHFTLHSSHIVELAKIFISEMLHLFSLLPGMYFPVAICIACFLKLQFQQQVFLLYP